MRKLSILSYIFAGLMLSSCDGYLKEDPRDQLYPEDAYDTPQNVYLNTVASLYNYIGGYSDSQGLQGTYRGVYDLNTFTTDEAMLPTRGGDWYDGGFWQGLIRMTALCSRSLHWDVSCGQEKHFSSQRSIIIQLL